MIIRHRSRVLKKENLSNDVINLKLQVPEDFEFIPGQYVEIKIPSEKEIIKRPYSICSSPNKKGIIELCIKNVQGPGTKHLFSAKKNDTLEIIGPIGSFKIKNQDKNIVLISNGTGIGPFRSMINSLLENNKENKITLITGHRTKEDLLYEKEFKKLEKDFSNFKYLPAISSEGKRVQDILGESLEENKDSDFYICGLYEMIEQVGKILSENKIPSTRILFEKYD